MSEPNSVNVPVGDPNQNNELERVNFDAIVAGYPDQDPVSHSLVRLDQERELAELVHSGTPVLIRGTWRMGKTSMLEAVGAHEQNPLIRDTKSDQVFGGEIEGFAQQFLLHEIAELIVAKENPDKKGSELYEQAYEKADEILASGQTPLAYLNKFVGDRGETAFVGLDEVAGFVEGFPERLEYITHLTDYSNLRIAFVLHRIHNLDELFTERFQGYTERFVQALILDEVAAIVRKPLENTPVTFSVDAIQELLLITGGRPMDINNICRGLMHPRSKYKNQKLAYTADDIRTFVTHDFDVMGNPSLEKVKRTYERVYKEAIGREERQFLVELADQGELSADSISTDLVQPLIDTTFVKKDEEKGVYTINGTYFQELIKRRYWGKVA